MLPSSTFLTVVFELSLLFCFVPFFVRIWFLNAFLRFIFPLPVTLNLFLAPDLVFNLGIYLIVILGTLLFFRLCSDHHKHSLTLQFRKHLHFTVFFERLGKFQQ